MMNKLFFVCIALTIGSEVGRVHAQTTWQLIWSDEFSGTSLNTGNWSYEFGNGGWGNNELQYYTNASENIEVSDGSLMITARHEGTGATEYTSARIITKNLFEFEYGKVEARMKLPLGQGLWPAFWTLGANIDEVSWPACGEIDIMEHVSNEYMTHGAVHWENNGHSYTGNGVNLDPMEFHVYGIIWEENLIRWFVDGMQFYQFPIQASNNTDDAFRHPAFLLLNMAIGGNWPGYPDALTPFPSSMWVDYVRVYQEVLPAAISQHVELDVHLYPVPALGSVQITAPETIRSCVLHAADGRVVYDFGTLSASARLSLESIAPGLYFLAVECGQQRTMKTLVVE
jgi:beta-glucanase (GH16 family)